jgi:eukaryotic-like serine/threonine-protein kinase
VRTPPPTKREGPEPVGRGESSLSSRSGRGTPAPHERFEPTPGLVVAGKYRVERVIGEGGMGIVVAATHVELDQRVAVKFLLPEAMRHTEVVERFLREAKVAAKVRSEHVARVTDVGRVEPSGIPFIVMEYLEGSDLGALIDSSGRLPLAEACEIGLQPCEALAEVHAAGIVHRDLKPSNLFITRRADGSPCLKLLDFGISKFTEREGGADGDPALTATATIMGSPSYMSPEQLRSTKEVDARTDVWALGAVLYEAVTGKPAFRGETVPQVCFLIGSTDPVSPSSLRPDVPHELARAILSSLDKKAETRATLVELAQALVDVAPPRARVSLERVEAVLGASSSSRRSGESLPVLTGTALEPSTQVARERRRAPAPPGGRTQSSWGAEPKRKRGGGASFLFLLGVLAAGVVAAGVYTGRIDLTAWRGPLTTPSSAPSAVSGTPAAAGPTVPGPATASGNAAVVPDLSAIDAAEGEEDAAVEAAPSASVAAHTPRAGPPGRTHTRPRRYVNKLVHRRH